jgi:hypothetical protein
VPSSNCRLAHHQDHAFDFGVLLLELEAHLMAFDEHDPDAADIGERPGRLALGAEREGEE